MHNLIRSPITTPRAIGAAVLALAIFALVMTQFVFTGETTHAQADNPPAAPTGLMASAVTHESLTLRWDEPQDASITHYQILRRNPATQDPGIFSTINSNTGSDDTSYTDSTVSYETKYVYRVVAVNSAGHSPRSNYVNVTTGSEPDETPTPTPAPEPVPSEPTGLTAPTVTHDSVSLSWNDPDDDSITHYKILRRNPQTDDPGQFTTIESNTGSSATFYTDFTVASETKYVYRVVAVNEAGDSPQSGYVNVSTPREAQPPAVPTGLSASAPDANTVNLSWNDPSDDSIDGYRILRRTRDGKKYGDNKGPAGFTTLVNDTRSADTSYTDRTVTAQTRYEYRIKARSADLLSTQSATVQVETPTATIGGRGTHVSLRGITIDGNAVPGVAASRFSYEYGVSSSTTQVTVSATATNSNSSTAITSPTDADTGTTGHQVNLSPGKNTVRITVTANDSTTGTYTLNINRGVTDTFGWNAEHDFDTLRAATNNNPRGIWSNGTTLWISDSYNDKLYAYNLTTGEYDSTKDFTTLKTAGNNNPRGIWSDGTTMWVADGEDKIYAYNLTSRERDSSKDFTNLGGAGNNHPHGIWSDRTTMWVADSEDRKLYAYNLTTGEYDSAKDFTTLHGARNDNPTGMWSDGTTMWVADGEDQKIYAYNMNTKAHDSSKDFNTLRGTGNNHPHGIWSDGTTMWVPDYFDAKVYAYNIGVSLDLTDITVDGASNPGFSPGGTSPQHGVSPDKARVTVGATREDSHASVAITSPADADTGTDGHQVDLSDGANAVTITVSFSGTKTYNLSINRGVYTLYGWAAQHDFATLALAGNGEPWGIWSDGTTMWVADSADAKIYAYNLATKARDPSKDFTSLSAAGNNAPTGIWSDGTTMWVADWVDTKIYAYNLTTRQRDIDKEFNEPLTTRIGNIRGIWSNGTTLWAADSDNDKLYAFNLTTKARESDKDFAHLRGADNNAPQGIWSDLTTMWVIDSSDDKAYAYNMTSRERDASKDFNTLNDAGNNLPFGTWSNGRTMWVADSDDDKLYAYNVAERTSVPDAPSNIGAESGDTEVTLTWDDPDNDTLTTYQYRVSADGGTTWNPDWTEIDSSSASTVSHIVASLTNGTEYTFEVRAVNSTGNGVSAQIKATPKRLSVATLSGITVNGAAVPGFDADRSSYEYGVSSTTTQVTIATTVTDSGSTATITSPDDADTDATGHQVNLNAGKNTVRITVTANDSTTVTYTLNINRGVTGDHGWNAEHDLDTLIAGGSSPQSLWSDGTTMWVVHSPTNQSAALHAYNLADGSRDTSQDFNTLTAAGNVQAVGIWSDRTTMWVSDQRNSKLYAYRMSDKARDPGKDFNTLAAAGQIYPTGIWSDGTTMWVAEDNESKVYAYRITDHTRDISKDFNILAKDLWSDGTTMWVTNLPNAIIHAYRLSDGGRDSSKDFNTLRAAGNTRPVGIWSDGTTAWVADSGDDKLYAYNLPISTDARLKDLTVSPKDIIGFDKDRALYEVGVASTVARATVSATANHRAASVIVKPNDVDDNTPGHQVDLTAGRNLVGIVVTAQDGTTTKRYRLYINRGVTDPFGWNADQDLDGLIAVGSIFPAGVWADQDTVWVSDINQQKIFAYRRSDGSRDSAKDFDTLSDAANTTPRGIWSNKTTMWVVDFAQEKIFAYNMSTKVRDTSKDFNTLTDAGQRAPQGIWSDGTTMWVLDGSDRKIFAYRMSDKTRDSTKDFDTLDTSGNDAPQGIWSDGTTMWVTDNTDDKIYAYRMLDTTRHSARDFNTLDAARNNDPTGIYSDGTTMWVSDADDDKVHAYNMPPSNDATLRTLHVSPKDIIGFQRFRDSYEVGMASTVASATITPVANHPDATFAITPTDADTRATGHQVDLSAGRNTVTVVVTAEDGTTGTYTISINRGVTDPFGWNADQDLDGLIAAGQSYPVGIWGNATTIWVTDAEDEKLYAYRRSDGSRDSAKDFDTLEEAGNTSTVGIWSDGTTMWVTDQTDAKIYAYRMSDKARDPSKDFNTLYRAGNRQPKGIWSDRTTMWVADNGDEKLFAYRMSDKARDSSKDFDTLEAAGNDWSIGIWSDGTTMWVSDQKDYKIYAYRMSDTARDSSRDFNSLNTTTSSRIWGIWSDSSIMWVIDRAEKKVYAYNMPFPPLTGLTATAGNGRVTLRWDNPDLSEITAYQYRVSDDDGTTWSPDWTNIPSSNGRTTSYTVRSLTNGITYTFEVKGTTSGAQQPPARETATPLGPPTAPGVPRNLDVASRDASLFATWDPPKEDERAPITDYRVRYRRASSSGRLTNVSRSATYNGPAQLVSDLTNGTTYEIQVSSVNRIGASAWTSATGTAQVQEDPPSDDGLAELNVGGLTAYWTDGPRSYDPHSRGDDNLLRGTCVETANFRVFWAGPDNGDNNSTPDAISWDAHVIAKHEPSTYEYYFGPEPDGSDFVRMYGMVDMQGSTVLTIRVRGLFDDQGWGQWSPPTSLYCFAD